MFGMRHATSFLFGEVVRYCRKDGLVTQQAPAIGSRKPDPYEQGVLKALSPNYEVTAVWTERYFLDVADCRQRP
jgi:hypothetical protein